MSNRAHAFGSLGEILAAGGAESLAVEIHRGSGPDFVAGLALGWFLHPTPQNVQALVSQANRQVASARVLQAQGNQGAIDLESIPVNPYLFGDEAAGRRTRVVVDAPIEGVDGPVRFYLDVDDTDTIEAMRKDILEQIGNIIKESPDAYKNATEDDIGNDFLVFISASRKF
jgi:hypothetical protein